MKFRVFGIFILTWCLTCQLFSQNTDTLGTYLKRTWQFEGQSLNYRILYPADFPDGGPYPLVLFLHGAGERGDDNEAQLIHGGQLFIDSLSKYPAVVIFPQCPRPDYWAQVRRSPETNLVNGFIHDTTPTAALSLVMELIKEKRLESYIDSNRVYLAGLSMGGMGTWELLWRMPGTFAVAMPICGGGAPKKGDWITDVPIWAFHGKLDDIVRPQYSIRMVEAVQKAGGKAKITIYTEANHNSWDPALAEPEFLKWMFSKTR